MSLPTISLKDFEWKRGWSSILCKKRKLIEHNPYGTLYNQIEIESHVTGTKYLFNYSHVTMEGSVCYIPSDSICPIRTAYFGYEREIDKLRKAVYGI